MFETILPFFYPEISYILNRNLDSGSGWLNKGKPLPVDYRKGKKPDFDFWIQCKTRVNVNIMAADFEYKQMLLELDKSLKAEEFESLKFLCKDEVKKRERESVNRPTDLWEILETREKLGPKNLAFLKQIIKGSCNGRLDIMRVIENFERGIPHDSQRPVNSSSVPTNQQYVQPVIYNPDPRQYGQQPAMYNRDRPQFSPTSKLIQRDVMNRLGTNSRVVVWVPFGG